MLSRHSNEAGWSVTFYDIAHVACGSGPDVRAGSHLSKFLTTDSGLSSSFLVGRVSALFLKTICKTPASIGDSEVGEVNAVGGNGFRRTGEEVCG